MRTILQYQVDLLEARIKELENTIDLMKSEVSKQDAYIKELKKEMDVVWNFVKPNPSNDMRWCDEIIIAIKQKIEEKV